MDKRKEKLYKRGVITLSVLVPIAVAALFGIKVEGMDFSYLPFYYARVNALTAVLLIAAFVAIKKGNRGLHQWLIVICLGLSLAFLVMYVMYHMTSEPTVFEKAGAVRVLYYVLLISHIILSVIVIPFVLFTLLRAVLKDFEGHKKLARYTLPIWLYVTITGVVVYFMISPYY